ESASAECQLDRIYPAVGLNKAITQIPVPYAEGETLTATVKTKSGFSCEDFSVEFRSCPLVGFSQSPACDQASLMGSAVIKNGTTTKDWTVKKLSGADNYRIRAVVGTGVGSGVSQGFSAEILIKSGQVCAITGFPVTRNGSTGPFSFLIKSNDKCEGKDATVQLILQPGGANAQIPGDIVARGVIKNNQFSASWTGTPSTNNFSFKGAIAGGGVIDSQAFLDGKPAPVPGTTVCGNKICEADETSSTCPTDCQGSGPTKPGETQKYSFNIPNPLKGGASDFTSLVKILAQWIFNLAIPIAVAMIVYAGILFLTAAGEPAKITKAKEVLKYAVIGLA
ncbi:MAG: pilin, partial [Patescibacteria group bacterium]